MKSQRLSSQRCVHLWKIIRSLSKIIGSLKENVPVSRKTCSLHVFRVFRSFQGHQRCPKTTLTFSWWAVPGNATSSITPSNSSTARQIIKTDHLATYDTSTSSDTIQTAHLHNENTSDDVYDSYVVISDSHITPSRNYNNPEEYHPKNTSISEYTIPDTQTEESTVLLVDYGVHIRKQ